MGVSVGDAAKDGVILQKQFEAPDIDAQGHHQEKEGDGDGNTAPGQGGGAFEAAFDQVRPAGHEQEEYGDDAEENGQHQEPAREGLPHRQGEEVEAERAPEDGVGDGGGTGRVEEEREGGPCAEHRVAADEGADDGNNPGSAAEYWIDGEIERAALEINLVGAGEIACVGSAECGERPPEEDSKSEQREDGEDG